MSNKLISGLEKPFFYLRNSLKSHDSCINVIIIISCDHLSSRHPMPGGSSLYDVVGSHADPFVSALPSAIGAAVVSFVLGLAFFALREPEVLLWACHSVLQIIAQAAQRMPTRPSSDSGTHDARLRDVKKQQRVGHAKRSPTIERQKRRHDAAGLWWLLNCSRRVKSKLAWATLQGGWTVVNTAT